MKMCLLFIALLIVAVDCFPAEPSAKKPASPAHQPNPGKLNPPPGILVPPEVKAELTASTTALAKRIDLLRADLASKPALLKLLPDVEIFYNAVHNALQDDIFYGTNQFKLARALLRQGMERAQQLRLDQIPWNTATGLVVRGYRSRLDGSAQPYGLVVPPNYNPADNPMRLDFWLHGRSDTLSEISFIEGRQKSAGEFTLENGFVLHPYGRFMNAFKFAGEVDVFEALEHVREHYPVDGNRIAMRGFSMGGAGTWHLGAHHASQWAAVNPGAGFVDVLNYQKIGNKLGSIPWYEQKLWHLYDPLACPINLVNTSLIAYSGEIDEQKKAADLMEAALAKEGAKMTHIIGPQTGHKYEPEAKKVVTKLVDGAVSKGREVVPRKVRLVTYSLKWNTMHWVRIDALEKHWEKAEALAEMITEAHGVRIEIKTRNIAAISLNILPGSMVGREAGLVVDGQDLGLRQSGAASWTVSAVKASGKWAVGDAPRVLAKRHNLQGPIDDAFMDSFLFVRPTGKPMNGSVGKWVDTELKDATFQWRRQFRGEPRVQDDTAITDADIAESNLILWGDPLSNKLLARIADKLPIRWTTEGIKVGDKAYDATKHVPVLIYPNPLNAERYVVINSGFTFPQFGASSNSQQTPKPPDWAVLDLSVPVAERVGGKGVVDANFFGELWELTATR